jgi:hypothetical protein
VGYSPDVQDGDAKGASWSIRWRQLRYVRIVSSARFPAPKFGGLAGSCRSWITICVWGDGGKGLIVMHQTNCRLIVVSSSTKPNVVKCAAFLRQLQPPRHSAWTLSNHKTPKRRHKRYVLQVSRPLIPVRFVSLVVQSSRPPVPGIAAKVVKHCSLVCRFSPANPHSKSVYKLLSFVRCDVQRVCSAYQYFLR